MLTLLQSADLSILHTLNVWSGNWLFDRLVHYIAGDRLLTGFIFLLPYWYFWFTPTPAGHERQDRRRQLLTGLFSGLFAILIARLMADLLPFRARPMFDHASGFAIATLDYDRDDDDFETWSSFPSDTAAFTFALSFALRRISPRLTWALLAYAFVVAGVFRDYLGVHYPSDSLVGALVGVVAAMLSTAPPFARPAHTLLRWEAAKPGVFYPLAFVVTAEMGQMFDNVRRAGHSLHRLLAHVHSGT